MGRTTRRTKERGIYEDKYGLSGVVTVNYQTHEKRFPFGTPLKIIRDWRRHTEEQFRQTKTTRARGTLAHDIEQYKKLITHLTSAPELGSVLKAWADRLGHKPRWKVSDDDVREARNAWLEEGTAPKTVNNRVAALRRVYRLLDGKRAWTPCDEIDPLAVSKPPPIFVTPDTIRATDDGLIEMERSRKLRDAKTRARFRILAASGVRPSELMRAIPSDVDLDRRVWRTRDGKGGIRPGGMYLTDDLLSAWRLFVSANAWGPFNTGSLGIRLRHAGWPEGVRPYQLRHTFGLALSEAGVDLADISALLGHSRPLTSRTHYVPVLGTRLQRAMTEIGTRIGWNEPEIEHHVMAPREKRKKHA